MAGIGGVCGLLIGLAFRLNLDLTFQIIAAIACAGLVGYARLKLNSHKPPRCTWDFLREFPYFWVLRCCYKNINREKSSNRLK